MDSVRIRLVFEEGHLLRKSQRKNGLKRSWILLKSHLHSISDFSSYLLDFFLLRDACPDGLILSVSMSLSLSGFHFSMHVMRGRKGEDWNSRKNSGFDDPQMNLTAPECTCFVWLFFV